MDANRAVELPSTEMRERDFARLSRLIHEECGIHLPPAKKTMLITRLLARLKELKLTSFAQYCEYVTSPQGRQVELPHMIDVVSTNKTEFFREPAHLEFLQRVLLPELALRKGRRGAVSLWSAGCSSGEEPYSLAMVMADWSEQCGPLRFTILATDISRRMLDRGRRAVYDMEAVRQVPLHILRRYFMHGKGTQADQVRVVPELRCLVEFRWLNLMQPFRELEAMDIIFCRNVMIYFDRTLQARLVEKLERQLVAGGYLFIGHSETINGINSRLKPVRPTVYQKPVS